MSPESPKAMAARKSRIASPVRFKRLRKSELYAPSEIGLTMKEYLKSLPKGLDSWVVFRKLRVGSTPNPVKGRRKV